MALTLAEAQKLLEEHGFTGFGKNYSKPHHPDDPSVVKQTTVSISTGSPSQGPEDRVQSITFCSVPEYESEVVEKFRDHSAALRIGGSGNFGLSVHISFSTR